ncbi:hypothetical protein QCA50_014263 [Cerrena zonata]|uniref:Uncharacterized protein n=1 Tax=Cerrena zonata TaxID=2478898 RepID=A0AAW0FLE9_9APHY
MVEHARLRLHAVEGAHAAAIYAPNLAETLAALREDSAAFRQDIAIIKQDSAAFRQDIAIIKQDIATVKEDMAVMKGDIATVKEDMAVMKGDMAVIKEEHVALQKSITDLNLAMSINNAMIANLHIKSENGVSQPKCEPLQKTVVGHDMTKIEKVTSSNDRIGLNALDPAAPIGALPPQFDPGVTNYSRGALARAMYFYNDTFGIVAQDGLAARREKFIKFLSRI